MPFNTTVTSEKMDLSDLFPEVTEEKESSLFTHHSDTISLDDLNEPETVIPKVIPPAVVVEPVVVKVVPPVVTTSLVSNLDDLENTSTEFEEAKAGTKTDLLDFFKTKIEAGELITFDDFDESKQTLEEYLKGFKKKDFDELWNSNLTQKEKDLSAELPKQFFSALPAEFQYAAQYYQDGGTDLKGIFKALAQVEEVKSLDPKTDAKKINETYLSAIKFGTDEEIKEQLDQWDDLGVTEKKAEGFKPKLDKMEKEVLDARVLAQSKVKQQQIDQYNFYHDNVVEAIKDQNLNGINIDKKVQSAIYTGLTQDTFKDSRGKRATEFEYMLDQIMWAKPDYKKLAKVYWMLKDEVAYDKAVSTKAVNKDVEETRRLLKTEQAKNTSSSSNDSETTKKRTIARPSTMFQRN